MQIIPVIDLKQGQVVHAVRGNRAAYQPIHLHSKLTQYSDIDSVISGFLKLHAFKFFYIADLDAIEGHDDHQQLINAVTQRHPQLDFWVDAGAKLTALERNRPANYKTVIGTESQHSPPQLTCHDFILSLDYKQQQPAGDLAWFNHSEFWPATVIVMTLNQVGSQAGPDWQALSTLINNHPNKQFVAAGGIRNNADLVRLEQMGINHALVATALHNGAIYNLSSKN